MNLEIQLLKTKEEFANIRDEWNALTERCAYPNIFTTWDWQSIWWKWFGTELRGKLWILTIRRTTTSELIGIVPFYRSHRLFPFFFGKRHIMLVGYGGRTCPEYLGPIIQQDCIDEVVDAVVNFIKDHPNEWDSIFFEDYALDDPGTISFVNKLKSTFSSLFGDGEGRYIIQLPDDYDTYLKSLSSHNRHRKRLMMNQAKKLYNAHVECQLSENQEEWFPLIVSLTTDARNHKNQSSPFLERTYAGFHRELLRSMLPQNRAIVQFLYFNECPVACWYAFLFHQKCYAYQQGSVRNVKGSPGTVGAFFLLEHCMKNGFEEFDFLRGGERYKTSFTSLFRATEWCFVFRKRGIAYWSRMLLERIVRPVYRKIKRIFRRLVEKQQTKEETQTAEKAT
ncbi:MAG: GNAT family N-acetyltransferase [Planctomycetaceae bacterium]|jgi:hypothetical protein|nr:GNAT family N-acetyltransferase [Planctomycetaceae bacterium]